MPPNLKPAIVLACFGTTDIEALNAIFNVEQRIKATFKDYEIHLAFTSNIIRKIWHQRAKDLSFIKAHPQVPESLYTITNPLTTLALIQEQGFRPVLVQSLHITNGSELAYVQNIVTQLGAITALQKDKKPFPYIALGDSALGDGSKSRLERAARALQPLITEAKSQEAALVFMGHGNNHLDVQSYPDFALATKDFYNYPVFMGLVEGGHQFNELLADLQKEEIKKILLAPLMLVAGEHAKNDMAGENQSSWANQLQAQGFEVHLRVKGLGLLDDWADIYVERIQEVEATFKQTYQ